MPSPVAPADVSGPATDRLPDGWQRGPFMQVFVRGYQDSDGDGVGDLRGLASRLDHLQSLGVRGIWLMPITPSADRDHGYATTDYRSVEPQYGTLADLDRLVREARRRGMGIVIDYVLNHASAEHPAFVSARRGPGAPFRDWFVWSDERPEGWFIWDKVPWYWTAGEPWRFTGAARDLPAPPAGVRGFYFGTFGAHMPDFDMRNPAVVAYHRDAMAFWLDRGLGGFRLDATPHLIENGARDWNDQPESRALTRALIDPLLRRGDRYVVCEATSKPEEWAAPDVCTASFAFGLNDELMQAARGEPGAVARVARRWATLPPTMATFLANHDRFGGRRLADQLRGDASGLRLAAASLLLGPGTPFLYYGEEIGMAGSPCPDGRDDCGDPPLRGPMSWTADPRTAGFSTTTPFRPPSRNVGDANVAAAERDPASLLATYRSLAALRHARVSLGAGRTVRAWDDGPLLLLERAAAGGTERTLVALNYGRDAVQASVAGLRPGARLRRLDGGPSAPRPVDAGGAASVPVPARGWSVWSVE